MKVPSAVSSFHFGLNLLKFVHQKRKGHIGASLTWIKEMCVRHARVMSKWSLYMTDAQIGLIVATPIIIVFSVAIAPMLFLNQ